MMCILLCILGILLNTYIVINLGLKFVVCKCLLPREVIPLFCAKS
jgi:hypothetical protein